MQNFLYAILVLWYFCLFHFYSANNSDNILSAMFDKKVQSIWFRSYSYTFSDTRNVSTNDLAQENQPP